MAGGIRAKLAGVVVWQVLEDAAVNLAQVSRVERPGDRADPKLLDARFGEFTLALHQAVWARHI